MKKEVAKDITSPLAPTDKEMEEILKHLKPIKKMLISQPQPANSDSPYLDLAKKYNLDLTFKQFIKIEPLPSKDFRKQKIDPLKFTAIIFTSKNAMDHFFELCKELKIDMPANMKYFCNTEFTANYLQKFITIRKRKIFAGKKTAADLIEIIKKHKSEKFLFPCSDVRREEIPEYMHANNFTFSEVIVYRTVANDMNGIDIKKFDLIAFFSPSGIKSLFDNFPAYKQGGTRIAAFGPTTGKMVRENNLRLDIEAPHPNAPSMAGAIELYIKATLGQEDVSKIFMREPKIDLKDLAPVEPVKKSRKVKDASAEGEAKPKKEKKTRVPKEKKEKDLSATPKKRGRKKASETTVAEDTKLVKKTKPKAKAAEAKQSKPKKEKVVASSKAKTSKAANDKAKKVSTKTKAAADKKDKKPKKVVAKV